MCACVGGGGVKGFESNTFPFHFYTPCQREVVHMMDHANDCTVHCDSAMYTNVHDVTPPLLMIIPYNTKKTEYLDGSELYTVCALIFAGFIFRGFAIFAFFAFLNSRLLGAVVLKYSRVKYSRIYGLSPYAIIVYGSCRSTKLLYSLLDSFEDVIVSNGELHPRISHLQRGMDAFH